MAVDLLSAVVFELLERSRRAWPRMAERLGYQLIADRLVEIVVVVVVAATNEH